MYGEIFALLLSFSIILIAVFSSHFTKVSTIYCKKSDIANLLADISDDTIIQVSIGRKKYEHKRTRNY